MKPVAGLAVIALLFHASAEDWPQWRGLNRNGLSSENININWPAEGPKKLWRAEVGTGFSSISISHGRACTMGNATNLDTVWCLDARSGSLIWKHTYPSQLGPQYYEGGPGSTPTFHRHRVYACSKWGDVFCLEAATGAVVWHTDLRRHGLKPNRWGFAGSSLVWRDMLLLNAGEAGTALDLKSGRVVWFNGTNAAGYASPTLFRSTHQSVLIFGAKNLYAIDPRTGRQIWRFPWQTDWDTNNSDPLVKDTQVFLSSFSRGCALLDVSGEPHPIYDTKALRLHLSPAVLLDDHLYAFNGEAHQETDFRCIELQTGALAWTRKDPAFGSLIAARDKLIILSEKGELLIAQASPKEFTPLAQAQVLNKVCWTPPALANGLLYVRNAKGDLLCLDLSKER